MDVQGNDNPIADVPHTDALASYPGSSGRYPPGWTCKGGSPLCSNPRTVAHDFIAEIEEATQEVVPVADKPEIVSNSGGDVLIRRLGTGLTRRVEVKMVFTDREAGPVPLHSTFWEDSLVSLGRDEVALFVNVDDVPKTTVEAIPRFGIGYSPAATRIYENCLTVVSLQTGECAFVLRVETPIPMNADVNPTRHSIASLGGGKVLLAHDRQLFSVDVNPRFRVTGPE